MRQWHKTRKDVIARLAQEFVRNGEQPMHHASDYGYSIEGQLPMSEADDIVAELDRWLGYTHFPGRVALQRARDEIVQLRAEVIDREGQRDALLNALRNARAEPCHGPDDRWCPVCGLGGDAA